MYAVAGSRIAASGTKILRRYQRSLSKHRMKLRRYNVRGTTHRNGIAATFWVRWLVTASRRAEAQAASPIQIRLSERLGGLAGSFARASSGAVRERQATV